MPDIGVPHPEGLLCVRTRVGTQTVLGLAGRMLHCLLLGAGSESGLQAGPERREDEQGTPRGGKQGRACACTCGRMSRCFQVCAHGRPLHLVQVHLVQERNQVLSVPEGLIVTRLSAAESALGAKRPESQPDGTCPPPARVSGRAPRGLPLYPPCLVP